MSGRALSGLVRLATRSVGANAPRVADEIIRLVWPETVATAESEGADRSLRRGLIQAIRPMVRGEASGVEGIDESLLPYVHGLLNGSYWVPSQEQYVSVAALAANVDLLGEATQYLHDKSMEILGATARLRVLHHAILSAEMADQP